MIGWSLGVPYFIVLSQIVTEILWESAPLIQLRVILFECFPENLIQFFNGDAESALKVQCTQKLNGK